MNKVFLLFFMTVVIFTLSLSGAESIPEVSRFKRWKEKVKSEKAIKKLDKKEAKKEYINETLIALNEEKVKYQEELESSQKNYEESVKELKGPIAKSVLLKKRLNKSGILQLIKACAKFFKNERENANCQKIKNTRKETKKELNEVRTDARKNRKELAKMNKKMIDNQLSVKDLNQKISNLEKKQDRIKNQESARSFRSESAQLAAKGRILYHRTNQSLVGSLRSELSSANVERIAGSASRSVGRIAGRDLPLASTRTVQSFNTNSCEICNDHHQRFHHNDGGSCRYLNGAEVNLKDDFALEANDRFYRERPEKHDLTLYDEQDDADNSTTAVSSTGSNDGENSFFDEDESVNLLSTETETETEEVDNWENLSENQLLEVDGIKK